MQRLVAFLDMLGTQESVRSGRFHSVDTLEFANPVGFAAMSCPEMQFAVFSDSVVVSAPIDHVDRFIGVLASFLGNWFYESILARGGIAVGEIQWVEQPSIDGHFRALRNFHYARVYGSALVEAINLERSSGPGAICFLSAAAAKHIAAVSSVYVLPGLTPMLAWADKSTSDAFIDLLTRVLAGEESSARYRHVAATLSFLEQAATANKFAPSGLANETLGGERSPNKRFQPRARRARRR